MDVSVSSNLVKVDNLAMGCMMVRGRVVKLRYGVVVQDVVTLVVLMDHVTNDASSTINVFN